jgi:hypothetical protein
MEASSFNDCEKDEENSHHNNNNIVNLFSQVLMKRYKFALTDLILSMHAILKLIEEAHQIFLKTIPNVYQISSSQQKTCLKKKKDSLNEVLELFFRKFVLIQEHVPRFLGEEEIVLFAKTLEENIKFPEMELFWDLKLDTNGREIAKKMSSLIQKLQIHIYPSFQQALEKNMTNCIRLTKKKEVSIPFCR